MSVLERQFPLSITLKGNKTSTLYNLLNLLKPTGYVMHQEV